MDHKTVQSSEYELINSKSDTEINAENGGI